MGESTSSVFCSNKPTHSMRTLFFFHFVLWQLSTLVKNVLGSLKLQCISRHDNVGANPQIPQAENIAKHMIRRGQPKGSQRAKLFQLTRKNGKKREASYFPWKKMSIDKTELNSIRRDRSYICRGELNESQWTENRRTGKIAIMLVYLSVLKQFALSKFDFCIFATPSFLLKEQWLPL